jgi:hypothetical protein
MSPHHTDEEPGTTPERFEYFMIRVTRSDHDPERVAGLVERLGSGEKRSFESGDQLLQLVGGWFSFSLNLQPQTSHSNIGETGSTGSSLGKDS